MSLPEWCLAEELSEFERETMRLDLLDSQRIQLELLFCELVAVEVLDSSGGVVTRATDLVREALSIKDFCRKRGE